MDLQTKEEIISKMGSILKELRNSDTKDAIIAEVRTLSLNIVKAIELANDRVVAAINNIKIEQPQPVAVAPQKAAVPEKEKIEEPPKIVEPQKEPEKEVKKKKEEK